LNDHQVAPRRPILLATFTIDVGVDALTRGISPDLRQRRCERHYTSSRSEPFSISRLRHLLGFLLRFSALLALARPCAALTRYVRNTITDG
jgi:hypothetical protein